MTAGQIIVQHGDNHYPIYVGDDGNYYAYDPDHLLEGKHGALPGASHEVMLDAAMSHGLAGLGASAAGRAAETIIPAALSFVPVVGPILAAVASVAAPIVGGMFGGDDPTPMSTLQNKAVSLRQQIVNAHRAMGVPDQMPSLPPGKTYVHDFPDLAVILELFPNLADTLDPNHWRCGKDPGVSCPHCGGVRVCTYDAIARLTPIAQQLSGQAQQSQIQQQVNTAVQNALQTSGSGNVTPAPGGYFTDPNTLPATTQASIAGMGSALTYLPLLLAGAALLFSSREKGSRYAPRRK